MAQVALVFVMFRSNPKGFGVFSFRSNPRPKTIDLNGHIRPKKYRFELRDPRLGYGDDIYKYL
jgi:hypothetical protein